MTFKVIVLCLLLFFIPFLTIAQTEEQKEDLKQTETKVDSLRQIWNHPDSNPVIRMNAASALINQYLYNNRDSALKYLRLIKDFSIEHDLSKGIIRSHYFKGILFNLSSQPDSSRLYYKLALDGYQSLDNTLQVSRTLLNIAILDYEAGAYKKAIEKLDDCIQMCKKAFGNEHAELGGIYGLKGNIYNEQGYNQLALQNALVALKFHEQSGDRIRKADMLNILGNIEFSLSNYDKVIEYNLEAVSIYQEYNDVYYQSQANADLGHAYIQLKQYEKATKYLDQGLVLATKMEAKDLEGKIYGYQSLVHAANGNDNQALHLLSKNLKIHSKMKAPAQMAYTLEQIGKIHLENKQPQLAVSYFTKAMNIADTIEITDQLHSSSFLRAKAFEQLNQPQLALQDLKIYQKLQDTLLNKTTINKIEELRIIHNVETKEKEIILQQSEISLLEKEAQLDSAKQKALWGGLTLTIIATFMALFGIQQRNKKKQAIESAKREKVEKELEFKKRELLAKVIQLSKKNEFLYSLEQEFNELKNSVGNSIQKSTNRINRMIATDAIDEKQWNQFSKEFSSVHQGFIDKLTEAYGSFSQSELRLASLLKMNLTSKDIANILRISDEGIKKARYRLRKKMKLESGDDLQGIILGL